jgi:plasmid stabilization system protein ParE
MARIAWSLDARVDLRLIVDSIHQYAPQAARSLNQRIRNRVRSLRLFPEAGMPSEDGDLLNIRELFEGPYRIIYEIDGSSIMILRIVHGRRDFRL